MNYALVVLLLLLAPTVTRGDAPPPPPPCLSHACSDDPEEVGNERVVWDPPTCLDVNADGACEAVEDYLIAEKFESSPLPETCQVRDAARRWWLPYASGCFPREGQRHYFVVRACGEHGCGAWSPQVEFEGMPYACLRSTASQSRCQYPCYDGQVLKLPLEVFPRCTEEVGAPDA